MIQFNINDLLKPITFKYDEHSEQMVIVLYEVSWPDDEEFNGARFLYTQKEDAEEVAQKEYVGTIGTVEEVYVWGI